MLNMLILMASVLLIFLVFCVVWMVLFVYILPLVFNIACVSRLSILDYPSGFSLTFINLCNLVCSNLIYLQVYFILRI
jgi:hypothetical protein